jgi:hypothetical protein
MKAARELPNMDFPYGVMTFKSHHALELAHAALSDRSCYDNNPNIGVITTKLRAKFYHYACREGIVFS